MVSSSGLSGAAPVWSQFMEFAVPYLTNGAPTPFLRPPGVVDKVVCRLSGAEPSRWCRSQYAEVFAADQPPLPPEQDLLRKMEIDLWTGLKASNACKGPSEEELVLNVADKWARDWLGTPEGRAWLENNGLPEKPYFAPERACKEGDPQPILEINLEDGQRVTSEILEIKGSAAADEGFKKWILEYGQGADPASWSVLAESNTPLENGTLYSWNVSGLSNGRISLRLTLVGDKAEVEKRIALNIDLPLPTPAPTETPTPTPTSAPPTETPTPTPTEPPPPPSDTPTALP